VLRDAVKIAFSYPSRLSGTQLCLVLAAWMMIRLYRVVRGFFQLTASGTSGPQQVVRVGTRRTWRNPMRTLRECRRRIQQQMQA
jgi:hypothetical protein